MKKKKIFAYLTGGAGFIGSAILWYLNKKGIYDIIVVDHLGESDKWKNLVGLKFLDYMEKDDFEAFLLKEELPYSADFFMHIGACSDTTNYNASYMIKNNYEYSKLAFLSSADKMHFIYASSGATYGDGSLGFSDDLKMLELLKPLNIYGYSKHLFDLFLKNLGVFNYNLSFYKVIGLKFFNVFGPNEYHKKDMRSVVLKAYLQIKKEKKVYLFKSYREDYKDGEQKRDFVYIKDVLDVIWFFVENIGTVPSDIYNVGSGVANTWNRLVTAIFSSLSLPVNIEYIDMPAYLRHKYQYYTKADISKLRKVGYKKEFSLLEDAVKDYVNGYLEKNAYLGWF